MPKCSPRRIISHQPKSILAAVLSVACFCSLGIEVPATWAASAAPAKDKKPKQDPALKGLPITELTPDEAILHALNRLAYGPRPGDIEKVRQMGLANWVDLQLKPNLIDDHMLDARLENLPTLRLSSAALIEDYPQPKQAEKQAEKKAANSGNSNRPSDNAALAIRRDMQPGSADAVGTGNDGANSNTAPPSSSAAVGQSAQMDSAQTNVADKASVPPSMKSGNRRRWEKEFTQWA
jgi:hypothetical protein